MVVGEAATVAVEMTAARVIVMGTVVTVAVAAVVTVAVGCCDYCRCYCWGF